MANRISVSDGHIFAVNDLHELIAIHPDNSVLPVTDDTHPGYEPIEIDGYACEIGWCEGHHDDYWCVIRHGCQIGEGIDREGADRRRAGRPCPHALAARTQARSFRQAGLAKVLVSSRRPANPLESLAMTLRIETAALPSCSTPPGNCS